jgi:histone acetyltransferase SAS3
VFNDLILPDDPMDGSRSLRKRKASNEDEPPLVRPLRKKRRPSEAASHDEAGDASLAASSPRAVRVAVSEAIETDDGHHTGSDDASPKRSSRSRNPRPKKVDKRPLAWIESNEGISLVVAFHLNNERVQKILSIKPKKKRIRDRSRKTQLVVAEEPEVSHYPAIQSHYSAPFYALTEKDMDETKNKPYGGILSEQDADTSKTFPGSADRKRFEDARQKAEEDWKQKQAALYGASEPSRSAHKMSGPPSKIKCISFGGWEIDTWHAAPYPEEYSKNKVLYICEFCLKYMNSDYVAWRHKVLCSRFMFMWQC